MWLVRKIYYFFIDIIQTLLLAASVFLIIYIFLFRPFQVSGASMFPTFHDQEYVLTNLITLRFDEIERGDVVVFQAPIDAEKDYIKRVIGLPGEAVSIINGQVYINNSLLDESEYLKNDVITNGGSFLREGEQVVIPEGEYFVIGDNRSGSSDSREWGFVKRELIIGRSMVVYWPVARFRWVTTPQY